MAFTYREREQETLNYREWKWILINIISIDPNMILIDMNINLLLGKTGNRTKAY
ncbi:MAG: hypothetical protein PVJ11_05020 [Syntrophobacterales bacterium]|jgi:hypothetical protein